MDDLTRLITRAQTGEPDDQRAAFDELVRRFQKMAFYTAYRRLNDPHLAEDVTQEAFLTAYQRIDQLREPEAFPGWLKRIVFTQADRQTRGQRPTLEPLDGRPDLPDELPGPESAVEDLEIRQMVQHAIAALPEHERAVTRRFYFQGESQKEIAEGLAVPVTTVKKRLQYAREHLRALMGGVNAAMDQAINEIIPPPPAQQRVTLRSQRRQP